MSESLSATDAKSSRGEPYLALNAQGHVIQPGPALDPRLIASTGKARRLAFELPVGLSLLDSVAEGLKRAGEPGCKGALLSLEGGAFGPFHYVIPSLAVSPANAAFYSETFSPAGETLLETGRLTFGARDGLPWLHCHGLWTEADGKLSGGHVLPEQAIIARPIAAVAWALDAAAFDTRHDKETNFNLLGPVSDAPTGRGETAAVAVRLKSGEDFAQSLAAVVRAQGWQTAAVIGGVGSIVGATFADGRTVSPRPTELFVRHGAVSRQDAVLDVAFVDHLGGRYEGLLAADNPVLMTMELGLLRTA
jgi:predicted DNA-binding protein with PD1-like motif